MMPTLSGLDESVSRTSFLWINTAVEKVLREYEDQQSAENRVIATLSPEELGRRRDDLIVTVGRATGILLNVIAREARAQSILELGTGVGYSTIWLAEAARATGGRVFTVDNVVHKQQHARSELERAGLLDSVEFFVADALSFLHVTKTTYDFVLLDLWKDLYIPCFDTLLPHLRPGATIIADNMCEPAVVRLAGARYQAHLHKIPDLKTVLLPVGSGLAISRLRAGIRS